MKNPDQGPLAGLRPAIESICYREANPNMTEDAALGQSTRITDAVMRRPDDHEDRMWRISKLIADLQTVKDRFGDTCVYIRRGGLSWGAVALNRRDDDKKHGVFDLQTAHDRTMEERLGQVERLIADRNEWRERACKAEAAASPSPQPPNLEALVREYARDLRRNASGGDDYPWSFAKGAADYLEALIEQSKAAEGQTPAGPCCPFCRRDPFHRVDNGLGMEAVAVTCCELGDAYFRGARPPLEEVTLGWDEFVQIGQRLSAAAAPPEKSGAFEFPYTRTFQAIAAATSLYAGGLGRQYISLEDYWQAVVHSK